MGDILWIILGVIIYIAITILLSEKPKGKTKKEKPKPLLTDGINVLLTGRAGNGKTTIAKHAILEARKHKWFKYIFTTGTGFRKADLVDAVLSEEPTIIFIDEIHTLPKKIYPALYTIMEERILTINGNVFDASNVWIWGATTDTGKLSDAIRSRFQLELFIPQMTQEELAQITRNKLVKIDKYIKLLSSMLINETRDIDIPQDIKTEAIKNLSIRTPREVKALFRLLQTIATLRKKPIVDRDCLKEVYDIYGYGEDGLTHKEREVVKILQRTPDNILTKNRIASMTGLDITELDEKILPSLIQKGKIIITSRGVELYE